MVSMAGAFTRRPSWVESGPFRHHMVRRKTARAAGNDMGRRFMASSL
jgi:hypothetical protein